MAAAAIASGAVALPDAGGAAGASVAAAAIGNRHGDRVRRASRPVRPAPARRPDRLRNRWPKPGRKADLRSISQASPSSRRAWYRRARAHRRSPRHWPRRRRAFWHWRRDRLNHSAPRGRQPPSRAIAGCPPRSRGVVGAALRGGLLLGARIVVGAGVVAVGGRVVVDQRRETVVSARLVGFAGFRRRRALERHVGYWICCHAGHGRPFANEVWTEISKDRATPGSKKYIMISNGCEVMAVNSTGPPRRPPFAARRQDLPLAVSKTAWRDCFTGIRPILKDCLSAAPKKPTAFPVPLQGFLSCKAFS